jgi:hypothetical protein
MSFQNSSSFIPPNITYAGTEPLFGGGGVSNQWSLYQAISDVDIDNFNINNVNTIDDAIQISAGVIISPTITTETINIKNTNDNITNLINATSGNVFINGSIIKTGFNVTTLNNLSNVVTISSTNNNLTVAEVGQDIQLTVLAGGIGVESLNSLVGNIGLTSTGGSVAITTVGNDINLESAAQAPTAWSSYPATQNVNMSNFNLTSTATSGVVVDAGASVVIPTVNITAQNGLGGKINMIANGGNGGESYGAIDITANGGTTLGLTAGGSINIISNTPVGTSGSFTGKVNIGAAGINSYAGATPTFLSLAGYNYIHGDVSVNITAGLSPIVPSDPLTVYLYGTNGTLMYGTQYMGKIRPYSDLTINPSDLRIEKYNNLITTGYIVIDGCKSLSMEPTANLTVSNGDGSNGQVLGKSGGNLAWVANGAASFVDSFQIYVAPNGNDTTGTGSQQNPYLTIAKALTQRALISNTIEVSIILSSGTYAENPTLTRNTYLVGVQTGESRQPCNITGAITLNDTTGSMGISGLEVIGSVSTLGLGGTYTIFGCNISSSATAITATTGSVFITECRISNTSGSTITSSSTILIRDCVISTSGTGSCVNGSAATTIRQSVITSSSASTGVQPLVNFSNSNAATTEISFCKLEYSSTVTDVSGNKCCVKFSGAGVATSSIFDSLLLCEGAITGSPQIQCVQDTGAGAVNISFGNLKAGATAHHISPNATKTAYITIT